MFNLLVYSLEPYTVNTKELLADEALKKCITKISIVTDKQRLQANSGGIVVQPEERNAEGIWYYQETTKNFDKLPVMYKGSLPTACPSLESSLVLSSSARFLRLSFGIERIQTCPRRSPHWARSNQRSLLLVQRAEGRGSLLPQSSDSRGIHCEQREIESGVDPTARLTHAVQQCRLVRRFRPCLVQTADESRFRDANGHAFLREEHREELRMERMGVETESSETGQSTATLDEISSNEQQQLSPRECHASLSPEG